MASNVYKIVSNCRSCAKTSTTFKHKRHLQLFFSTEPLEFVTMDILGPVHKTIKGKQHVVIITDWCSKLKRAVPTPRTTTTTVACIFSEASVNPYGIPSYLRTDKGT